MKIGLRAGHSPNCLGAVELRNEWACMNELYKYVEATLKEYGHTVINCNTTAGTQDQELFAGVSRANANNVDLFMSLHMNCSDGNGHGVEAWTYNRFSRANAIAERLCKNFSTLGLYNRGVQYNSNYYEMRHADAPNIIFETMFCDNAHDINKVWSPTSYEKMGRLIANAIDPNIPIEKPADKYQIRVFSFLSKEEADKCSQIITRDHGWYNVVEKM